MRYVSRQARQNRPATPALNLRPAAATFGLVALLGTSALAQEASPARPLGGEPPTTGIRLHAPTLVGRVDATAIEVNPAALSLLQGWSAVYHHSEIPSDGRVQGRGDGLFLALPLPLLRRTTFGASVQWLRPSDPIGYEDTVKLSLSFAWSPIRYLGFGFAFHSFISDDDPAIDRLEAVDAGLVVRPNQWVGLGFVARNLNTPNYDDFPLQRVYDMELTVRPLGTRRLEIGAGLAVGERRAEVDPHLRIVGEPVPGLSLFGHAELLQRDFYRDDDQRWDARATLGLQLSFERLSFSASTLVGRSFDSGPGGIGQLDDARSAFQGVNVSVAASGVRNRSLLPRKRVLQLALTGRLDQRRWAAMVGVLRRVERRDDVVGVLLQLDGLALGWGIAQEMRSWVDRLRASGKKVYAYLQAPTTREYYAVAGAEKVWLSPAGGIRLQGLSSQQLYLRGLFDKLGVEPQFIRLAEYKSAPESYTRRGPSAPAKQMLSALVDDLYAQLTTDLAASRRQSPEQLRATIDQGPFTPDRAKSAGLIDELLDAEDLPKQAAKRMGGRLASPAELGRRRSERWPVGPAIAVVVIEGDIVHGKSRKIPLLERRMAGDETLAQTLARVRADSRIRAVVLRINSPGGSALASERIWQAVRRTAEKKPVVASLANVAASGGYYAAAGAHRIIANRATVTGSIGIFTGKFGLEKTLSKLGISVDTTERGKRAGLDSPFRPYSLDEQRFILSRLQYYYRRFLQAVGMGRKMSADAVHEVARGRVWTGQQAQAKRLVDGHGGLSAAIDEAKKRAGLPTDRPVELVVLPRPERGLLERVIGLGATTRSSTDLAQAIPPMLHAQLRQLPAVLWYARPADPLTLLPFAWSAD